VVYDQYSGAIANWPHLIRVKAAVWPQSKSSTKATMFGYLNRSLSTKVLPLTTSTGQQLGMCLENNTPREILERLKFHSDLLHLFRSTHLHVASTSKEFVLEIPTLRHRAPVSIIHPCGESLKSLPECFSVTREGELHFTRADVERPRAGETTARVLKSLLEHKAMSYLQGLDVKLAAYIHGSWVHLTRDVLDEEVTELGLVVPENSVRVVQLKFDETVIMSALRLRPHRTLLETLRGNCDWRAWPAVEACTVEPTLGSDDSINMAGESGTHANCRWGR
jgi:hypothetical protein